jgi:hypothetical protein
MKGPDRSPEDPARMKIAAIDLGSNSFHLVILEVRWPS